MTTQQFFLFFLEAALHRSCSYLLNPQLPLHPLRQPLLQSTEELKAKDALTFPPSSLLAITSPVLIPFCWPGRKKCPSSFQGQHLPRGLISSLLPPSRPHTILHLLSLLCLLHLPDLSPQPRTSSCPPNPKRNPPSLLSASLTYHLLSSVLLPSVTSIIWVYFLTSLLSLFLGHTFCCKIQYEYKTDNL